MRHAPGKLTFSPCPIGGEVPRVDLEHARHTPQSLRSKGLVGIADELRLAIIRSPHYLVRFLQGKPFITGARMRA